MESGVSSKVLSAVFILMLLLGQLVFVGAAKWKESDVDDDDNGSGSNVAGTVGPCSSGPGKKADTVTQTLRFTDWDDQALQSGIVQYYSNSYKYIGETTLSDGAAEIDLQEGGCYHVEYYTSGGEFWAANGIVPATDGAAMTIDHNAPRILSLADGMDGAPLPGDKVEFTFTIANPREGMQANLVLFLDLDGTPVTVSTSTSLQAKKDSMEKTLTYTIPDHFTGDISVTARLDAKLHQNYQETSTLTDAITYTVDSIPGDLEFTLKEGRTSVSGFTVGVYTPGYGETVTTGSTDGEELLLEDIDNGFYIYEIYQGDHGGVVDSGTVFVSGGETTEVKAKVTFPYLTKAKVSKGKIQTTVRNYETRVVDVKLDILGPQGESQRVTLYENSTVKAGKTLTTKLSPPDWFTDDDGTNSLEVFTWLNDGWVLTEAQAF